MNKITYIKQNDLNNIKNINELENYFITLTKYFEMNIHWKKEFFFQNEIKKSLIRALLRESSCSKHLLCNAIENFKKSAFFDEKIKWCTKLYPMIHLSNDKSEAIGFHYDKIGNNKFFTTWVPITDYDYPALSYVKYSQLFYSLLSKVIIKFRLTKIFSKNIFVKKGDILIWNGNMIHQGNLNNSKKIAVAFQMKFTEKKFKHEDSILIKNFNIEQNNTYENLDVITKKFNEIIMFCKKLNTNITESIFKISCYIKENSFSTNLVISFALSVLAQRLSTTNFNLDGINKKKLLINNLDIFSIYLGAENLASLDRLLKKGNKDQIIKNLEKTDHNNVFQNRKVILDYLNK